MVSLLRAVPIAENRKIPLQQPFADPKTLVGKDIGGGRWLRHAAVPTFEQPETRMQEHSWMRLPRTSSSRPLLHGFFTEGTTFSTRRRPNVTSVIAPYRLSA
jgi:hypothetical protein